MSYCIDFDETNLDNLICSEQKFVFNLFNKFIVIWRIQHYSCEFTIFQHPPYWFLFCVLLDYACWYVVCCYSTGHGLQHFCSGLFRVWWRQFIVHYISILAAATFIENPLSVKRKSLENLQKSSNSSKFNEKSSRNFLSQTSVLPIATPVKIGGNTK